MIGYDKSNAVMLHTKNGGRKWVVQGKWAGYAGNDNIAAHPKPHGLNDEGAGGARRGDGAVLLRGVH